MKKPLFVITGPTACGKTAAAVALAKRVGGEVVSADSMLVYRGMDIGTAKPSLEERDGVPHHLIDVVNPDETFSAARYQQMAAAVIADIHARGRIPILAGGTGFYINAVVYGNMFVSDDNPNDAEDAYRTLLITQASQKGAMYLHDQLHAVDSAAAATIHPNNIKRVARALSFYHHTGMRISEHNAQQRCNTPVYDVTFVVLHMQRALLYQRIDERVTHMYEAGLANEVRGLLNAGYATTLTSMQGIGYKETTAYLQGDCTLSQAMDTVRLHTRHYAKRQLTWFSHRVPDAFWLDTDGASPDTLVDSIMDFSSTGVRAEVPQQ